MLLLPALITSGNSQTSESDSYLSAESHINGLSLINVIYKQLVEVFV